MYQGKGKKCTSKGKRELEKRNGGAPAGSVAVVHDSDVRISAAEFCVDDNETDCPVCHAAEHDQKENSEEEACLADGIGKTLSNQRDEMRFGLGGLTNDS